jgi:hypothetical protein
MIGRFGGVLLAGVVVVALSAVAAAEPTAFEKLAAEYQQHVRPVLKEFCLDCHSTKAREGELDLERFADFPQVRKSPQAWQKVEEMLRLGEMPPKESRQPSEVQRTRLHGWVRKYLDAEAQARAGDPGPVVLRRLNNSEFTYTLRDLTGVENLNPAREFPVDGAAGEGFTNTGQSLVMSPSLVSKYLDAAKDVASHAVLLPDGIRFSPHTTRRDWTNDTLTEIREFYRQFTDQGGGTQVNLQGIISETNQGGRLPLEKYVTATLAERADLASGRKSIEQVARERGLSPKYLGILWQSLTDSKPSLLLTGLRARWRAAKPSDAGAIMEEIASWQKSLFKFSTVGHIGKLGGPQRWLEEVNPVAAQQDFQLKLPEAAVGETITVSLVATDAGDGNEHDVVVWKQPRFVAPGRPDLLLKDLRRLSHQLEQRREHLLANTTKYLAAATDAVRQPKFDVAQLAAKHGVDAAGLRAWLEYLGVGTQDVVRVEGHFTNKLTKSGNYDFINGWGRNETPLLVTNSSDQHVRIPGNMPPHSVAVHPSPTLRAAVGWRSPVTSTLRIEGSVTHAHPECGNGVTWSLELRRGTTRRRLANGIAQGSKGATVGPLDSFAVQSGDLISLLIGPRDGNHSCDLTTVELKLTTDGADRKTWSLKEDVSGDVLAGNPRADRFGNADVWHFYSEPDQAGELAPVVPANSVLDQWQREPDLVKRQTLAEQVQQLLRSKSPPPKETPDGELFRQLASFNGPLFRFAPTTNDDSSLDAAVATSNWGLDPALFGKRPDGEPIEAASLCVKAPSVVTFQVPADLLAGRQLVVTGTLEPQLGAEGSVQLQLVTGTPPSEASLRPSEVTVTRDNGSWTSDNRRTSFAAPVLVLEASAARRRVLEAFDDFRRVFPAALCYTKIVPVDEVVTLTLFYREDDHLVRLMLDEAQAAKLDRLWDELHYISHDALTLVDAFAQLWEYATQDADPKVFEPLRKPIHDRAAAFRRRLIETEPQHVAAVLEFANRAYRRPLTDGESRELRSLYEQLRQQDIPHDAAIRLLLARVLVAPAFLYRIETPAPGVAQQPVSDWELATRLSYFLWSSQPDAELRRVAAAGQLRDSETLRTQTRRMLQDDRVRRLAIEFACQWLHIRDFDQLEEKSERHFPTFVGLRGAMYEESIRFFTDLFQHDRSVLNILDADYVFVNAELAKHYGLPFPVESADRQAEWRRIDGAKQFGRGGILAQATTLATQSGASRTSPILRGNWISEVLLGERLPRPPKGVPQLPEDETATDGLTVRQLVERHSSDAKCAVCHRRIDPFGFSLESFDAIGRRRETDLAGRPIDTRVKAIDGAEFAGLEGLRQYLLVNRRDAILRQFCKKLLGFALGRAVQLSDEPLLSEMQTKLQANDYRFSVAVEAIVLSRQFREIRGRDAEFETDVAEPER